jgi:RNase P subunit RPR2
VKKTDYLVFCDDCGHPLKIPREIIKVYLSHNGVTGVYCEHCCKKIKLPDYVKKLSEDL